MSNWQSWDAHVEAAAIGYSNLLENCCQVKGNCIVPKHSQKTHNVGPYYT